MGKFVIVFPKGRVKHLIANRKWSPRKHIYQTYSLPNAVNLHITIS